MALGDAKSGRDVDPTLRPDSRLAFRRPGRQTHGAHRTQGIIFADEPPREPEEIDGNLECEVEKIIRSEIIAYTKKVRRRNKRMRELRYFVKWKGCSEDENTWEPPEGLDNAQE